MQDSPIPASTTSPAAKPLLGISSCLLGNRVRYDGGHKRDQYITDILGRFFEWIPVCPESACGLGTPREAMRLVGDARDHRLVTITSGIDHTIRMEHWIASAVEDLGSRNLAGFIFKSRSPSCAVSDAGVHGSGDAATTDGPGLFARAFMDRFPLVPVIDERRLADQALSDNFVERVFVCARWQALIRSQPRSSDLAAFHAAHKYLIMSHNPTTVSELGRIVASSSGIVTATLLDRYASRLMQTLALVATVKKHTNVLQHIAGYFKKQLSSVQKQELGTSIDSYHDGLVPLSAPLALLRHYVHLYDEPYLKTQVYLDLHPGELMSRDHR
jgi:uncharacterized protein YbgA (DUF1722 family)/uncharacterized protein YbbK (DUF523 family)